MEGLGNQRVQFALSGQPVVLFNPKVRRTARRFEPTPPFEPYAENLPLQSGYYTFVIDEKGRFRVKWGNTSSHGSMVGHQQVAAAGNFRISRIGKLAEVTIISYDYGILCSGPNDRVVRYVIASFVGHPAFDASEHAIFHFSRRRYETTSVNRRGESLGADEIRKHQDLLESEGLGDSIANKLDTTQIQLFHSYKPTKPPCLYSMERDQLVISIEEGDAIADFRPGPAYPKYSPDASDLHVGKSNFVIDRDGWLIVGVSAHHILSGGFEVGGAGHIAVNGSGNVCDVQFWLFSKACG